MNSKANELERRRIIKQVLDATTLAEIKAATEALDEWLGIYPDDHGMEDGYEQLALMRNAQLAIASEKSEPVAVS
jgi:hypothetical protein